MAKGESQNRGRIWNYGCGFDNMLGWSSYNV